MENIDGIAYVSAIERLKYMLANGIALDSCCYVNCRAESTHQAFYYAKNGEPIPPQQTGTVFYIGESKIFRDAVQRVREANLKTMWPLIEFC